MRRFAVPAALVALIVCSAVLRDWFNRRFQSPQLLCDEFIYADLAKSFATTGHLRLRGETGFSTNLLYAVLIAPAWLAHRMSTVYGLAKAINALLVSLTAVPVFFWARRVMSSWWALLAAGLVLVLPVLVLSGMLMSENAALPTFMAALFAISITVERPTLVRQAIVIATLAAAYEARTQGLVLVAVLVTAVLLKLVLDIRTGRPRREVLGELKAFVPIAAALAVGAFAVLARHNFSPGKAVGFYHAVATTHYDLASVAYWTLRHAGDAVLAVGVAPACALLLLFVMALRGRFARLEDRAFLATASAAVFWFLVQAGAYGSAFGFWISERYSCYALPPLLIAFVLWLAKGLPRPLIETGIAAAASVGLGLLVVFGPFIEPEADASHGVFATLTLHFFSRISEQAPGGVTGARAGLTIAAVVAAAVFALAPAWFARPGLPAAIVVLLGLVSHSVYGNLVQHSLAWPNATGPVRSWIDNAVGTRANRVAYIYVPNPSIPDSSTVLMNTEFWNRSIGDVFTLGAPQLCSLPARNLRVDPGTGRLIDVANATPPREQYVVTDQSLALAGKEIVAGGSVVQPLVVFEAPRSLRFASQVEGVYSDGWTGPQASFLQFWSPKPRAGSVLVTMSRAGWIGPDVPGIVSVRVRRLRRGSPTDAVRHWTAHSGETKAVSLPVPPPPFRVDVRVNPTFSPSQFGKPDARQLGVQISFAYKLGRR